MKPSHGTRYISLNLLQATFRLPTLSHVVTELREIVPACVKNQLEFVINALKLNQFIEKQFDAKNLDMNRP